jgi:hypothetical protein
LEFLLPHAYELLEFLLGEIHLATLCPMRGRVEIGGSANRAYFSYGSVRSQGDGIGWLRNVKLWKTRHLCPGTIFPPEMRRSVAGLYDQVGPRNHQGMLGNILELILSCLRDMVVGILGRRAEAFLSQLLKRKLGKRIEMSEPEER